MKHTAPNSLSPEAKRFRRTIARIRLRRRVLGIIRRALGRRAAR